MRGAFRDQGSMFSYVLPEQRIPAEHPLRPIRGLVRDVLNGLSRSLNRLYSHDGRPSIPPEQLLSALLVQVLYGIRSERQLMEQLDYNLLFRWFVGLSPDDPIWDASVFTKNRERLQEGDIFQKFMNGLLNHPRVKALLSDEHFSVDGTLIEPRRRALSPRAGRTRTTAQISTVTSARTTPMPRLPIQKPSSIARQMGARPSSAIWAMS
jgi:transposase